MEEGIKTGGDGKGRRCFSPCSSAERQLLPMEAGWRLSAGGPELQKPGHTMTSLWSLPQGAVQMCVCPLKAS